MHFCKLKETQPTILFSTYKDVYFLRLGAAIFKVTLREHAQIFVKKSTIYKNHMTQFVFVFYTRIKYEE